MSKLRQKFQQNSLHAELSRLLLILFAGTVAIGSTYIVSDAMANRKIPSPTALTPNSKHPAATSLLDLKTTSPRNSKPSSKLALTPSSRRPEAPSVHDLKSNSPHTANHSSTSELTPNSKHPQARITNKRRHLATAPTSVRQVNSPTHPLFSLILFSVLLFFGLLLVAGRATHTTHLDRLLAMKKKRSEELLDHPTTLSFRMDAQTAFKNLLIDLPGMPVELPGVRATNWRLVESNPSRLHLRLQLRYFHCVTGANSGQLYPRTMNCDATVTTNGIMNSEVTLVYGSYSAMDHSTVENIVQATNTGLLLTLHNQRMLNSMAALDAQIKSNRVTYVQPARNPNNLPAPDTSELLSAVDAHINEINEAALVSPLPSLPTVVAVSASTGVTSAISTTANFESASLPELRPSPNLATSEAEHVPAFTASSSSTVLVGNASVDSEAPLPPQEDSASADNAASHQMPNQFEPTPLDYKFLLSA